jgi:ERCC4-related helicase
MKASFRNMNFKPDNIKDEAMMDYMQKHMEYLPDTAELKLKKTDFEKYNRILNSKKTNIKQKEKAIMLLAHSNSDKAIKILKQCIKKNVIHHPKLQIWLELGLSELEGCMGYVNENDTGMLTMPLSENLSDKDRKQIMSDLLDLMNDEFI